MEKLIDSREMGEISTWLNEIMHFSVSTPIQAVMVPRKLARFYKSSDNNQTFTENRSKPTSCLDCEPLGPSTWLEW